ncbi:MAG: cytochrome c biogenesis protein CcsA [Desulfovibrio sp.]|nr:cytochrome c biogenesis protein CcsA [Desulfovibrio sp.]
MLLHGLFWRDYSLVYVASYTDDYLSIFYRLTAFWAGQPGSMLFWAICTCIFGTIFALSPSYKNIPEGSKTWFWVFFHLIVFFFGLLLIVYSNPFIMQHPAPADGNGLNPLLQNPGMIVHPPLLFIGYAGFIIPSSLALGQAMCGAENPGSPWYTLTRNFILFSWMFLTAGIILGAWWAYMELGWGGYWGWDPVENSSLIPWLFATALLHTIHIEQKTKTFVRFNCWLIQLTTISTFFATYLVRSGVIDSVHAFGQGAVGDPLLAGILLFGVLAFCISITRPHSDEGLAGIVTKEGFLALMMWILLALGLIIFTATLWPVFSKLFSAQAQGLDATFYNKVCLPLATGLLLIMAFCPWLPSRSEKLRPKALLLTAFFFLITCLIMFFLGYAKPVPLLAQGACVSMMATLLIKSIDQKAYKKSSLLCMIGTHLGVAILALGIAFSGPYSVEKDFLLGEGDRGELDGYSISLASVNQVDSPGYSALLAKLSVEKNGKILGELVPERRIYEKFGDMQFSEVDTIASLGNELYVSLLGLNSNRQVVIRFSIKPLVNWLWIGGILMCLMPIFGLRRLKNNNSSTVKA